MSCDSLQTPLSLVDDNDLLQKQEAQFKAAELEFHKEQLQHVSKEQRHAEEHIHNSRGAAPVNGFQPSGKHI